jgi:hypothetical protein
VFIGVNRNPMLKRHAVIQSTQLMGLSRVRNENQYEVIDKHP